MVIEVTAFPDLKIVEILIYGASEPIWGEEVNITSEAQMIRLIKKLRKSSRKLGWNVG